MWKTVFGLMAMLSVPATSPGADFWQVKDPDAWTEKEVESFRRNSPWARGGSLEKPGTAPVEKTTGTGKSAKTKTTTKKVWSRVHSVQFRWESAPPMLAATARVDAQLHKAFEILAKDYYLVSVTGLDLPNGANLEAAGEEIRLKSVLQFGDQATHPRVVRGMDSGRGFFFLLQFPRALGLESQRKDLEVKVYQGTARAMTWFEPKHMILQERPAL